MYNKQNWLHYAVKQIAAYRLISNAKSHSFPQRNANESMVRNNPVNPHTFLYNAVWSFYII